MSTLALENEFKTTFFEKIKSSDFEYGFFSNADEYLETFIDHNGNRCFSWIYELYLARSHDEEFIIGLLKTLAHLPAKKITPECIEIAKKSLIHESPDIKESAVMAFEKWEYTAAIPFLEATHFSDSFLEDYLRGVIQDLKELQHGVDGQKD